ncbi:MAG: hypothetical protein IIY74_00750, partial [Firmicutes bacterium]|nr:hypothetical protein [Bacillota bacterium]
MGANKKRRILSLILTLALLMTMYVPVHAAEAANIFIGAKTGFDSETIPVGAEVSITVSCKDTTVASFDGGLHFNTELFECISIKNDG